MFPEYSNQFIMVVYKIAHPGLEGLKPPGLHAAKQVILIDEEMGQVPGGQEVLELLKHSQHSMVNGLHLPAWSQIYREIKRVEEDGFDLVGC